MKFFSIIIFLLISTSIAYSQSYNIDAHSTVTTCSGTFYDSGGSSGDYDDDEDETITICPNPGMSMRVTFTSFDLGPDDELCIYDGDNTGAYQFGCGTEDIDYNGMVVQATDSNTTGCLTFHFTSNWALLGSEGAGWSANLECFYPCQYIEAVVDNTVPAATVEGNIDICQNTTVNFTAHGVYHENNINYPQSDATSTFTWDFGDGTTQSGVNLTSVSHTYDSVSAFPVRLTITDDNGCKSSNLTNYLVRVSTTPIFAGTNAAQSSICYNETTTLTGVTAPVEQVGIRTMVIDTTFLPDGSGASYSSVITYDCFPPGSTITDMNLFQSICANMEHSYLGDLDIYIKCPNNTEIQLQSQSGGGTHLGEPVDDPDNTITPGNGYEYCWNMNPTFGTMEDEANGSPPQHDYTDNDGVQHFGKAYLPAGSYASYEDLSGLIGCPLNGDWTIKVVDNLAQDNGYIFTWTLLMDPSLYPQDMVYQPTIVNEYWEPDPTIISTNGNTAQVGPVDPSLAGTYTYTYTVEDDFGCTYDTTITVEILPPAQCGYVGADFTYNGDQCLHGHSFDFTNTGTGDYFEWSFTGGTPASSTLENPTGVKWNTDGTYQVTLTVYNSDSTLTESISKNITIYPEPEATSSVLFHEHCSLSDASANVSVTNGTTPYTYDWQPGGQTAQTATGLSQGTYNIYISDGNGCTDTTTVTVNSIPGPTISTTKNDEYCGQCNGDATVSIDAGGTAPFTYNWKNISTNQNVGTTQTVSNLCAGTYEVTVTDSAGCTDTETVIIQSLPGPTDVAVSITGDYCNLGTGEAVVTNVTGGAPNYGYQWQRNTQIIGYDSLVTGLSAGSYTITVTDNNGCEYSENITVDSLPGFFVNTSSTADKCGQCIGTATVNINGGNPQYNYIWDNGTPVTSPQTTNTASNLCAGNHSLRVEDNLGCYQTITITIDEIPGPEISIVDSEDISCFGQADGEATAQATPGGAGGSTSFTYQWDNNPALIGSSASNLSQGTHTVTVTDANNCTNSTTVLINEPSELTATITDIRNPLCFGQNNGYATVTPTGGTTPYTYFWTSNSTGQTANSLSSGFYTVTVTDNNGCTAQDTITLIDPMILTCSITDTVNEICENGQNGSATVGAQGGTMPYSYTWIPSGQQGQTANNLTNGTYSVEVQDANGCTCQSQVNITTQYAPTFNILVTDDQCNYCNGELESTQPVGGNGGPYTYLWVNSTGDTISSSSNITDLCAGTYRLIVSDGECKRMQPASVQSQGGLELEAVASPYQASILNPEINFYSESQGEDTDSCYWDFGDGTSAFTCNPTHSYPHSGTYDVTLIAQDEYGCLDTSYITVEVVDIFTFYIPNSFSPNGDGINDLFGPKGTNIDEGEFELRIYNRWGEQVYYSTDPFERWNGRKNNTGKNIVSEGVYVYRILLQDIFGQPYEYFGHVNLIK